MFVSENQENFPSDENGFSLVEIGHRVQEKVKADKGYYFLMKIQAFL